jgi:DNA-directed RNA polymerase specialized sigma24 family protein
MSSEPDAGTVTIWIGDLKNGGDTAANHLWNRYCHRLEQIARRDLGRKLPKGGIGGPDDAANSAFHSFCKGVRGNRYPRLNDRDDLWRLLVFITRRKVSDRVRYECGVERGGGRVVRAGEMRADNDGVGVDDQDQLGAARQRRGGAWINADPSPEEVVIQAEEVERLLDKLGDETLKSIVLAKLEGLTDEEVAARFGKYREWVVRRLKVCRVRLRAAAGGGDDGDDGLA